VLVVLATGCGMSPVIAFGPVTLGFTATEGGANSANQTLDVWNSGGGTLNWSVADDAAWLSLAPPSGNSNGEHDVITLSVDITRLSAGVYNADITITAPGATNTPQTMPVSLSVEAPTIPMTLYENTEHGFTIEYPEGWTRMSRG